MYDKTTFVLKRVFGGTEETIDIVVSFRPSINIQYDSHFRRRYLIFFFQRKFLSLLKAQLQTSMLQKIKTKYLYSAVSVMESFASLKI